MLFCRGNLSILFKKVHNNLIIKINIRKKCYKSGECSMINIFEVLFIEIGTELQNLLKIVKYTF